MSESIFAKGWMQLFTQMRSPNMFLARMFTLREGNETKGEEVVIDIERYDEDVAIVVKAFTGPNLNDFSQFTTKTIKPPAYGEAFPINANDLIKRIAGDNSFSDNRRSYASKLMVLMAKGFKLISDKISRAIELQASQVLQTGKLLLTDENGNTTYEIDYKPKATHFPTVTTAWSDTVNADPIADLEALAEVIRADGKVDPDMLIMGATALRNFLDNDKVKSLLENRRYEIGQIAPRFVDSGATLYGRVWVGTYAMQIWAYPDTYKHPQTGLPTKYIEDDKVVMLSSRTRLDIVSGDIPLPVGPDPRVASLMPGRMTNVEAGFDVTPNIYPSPNGKQVMGELEGRLLMVPVQIDGFGCLDVAP